MRHDETATRDQTLRDIVANLGDLARAVQRELERLQRIVEGEQSGDANG